MMETINTPSGYLIKLPNGWKIENKGYISGFKYYRLSPFLEFDSCPVRGRVTSQPNKHYQG